VIPSYVYFVYINNLFIEPMDAQGMSIPRISTAVGLVKKLHDIAGII